MLLIYEISLSVKFSDRASPSRAPPAAPRFMLYLFGNVGLQSSHVDPSPAPCPVPTAASPFSSCPQQLLLSKNSWFGLLNFLHILLEPSFLLDSGKWIFHQALPDDAAPSTSSSLRLSSSSSSGDRRKQEQPAGWKALPAAAVTQTQPNPAGISPRDTAHREQELFLLENYNGLLKINKSGHRGCSQCCQTKL